MDGITSKIKNPYASRAGSRKGPAQGDKNYHSMNYTYEMAARDSQRALAGHRARKDISDRTTMCMHGWPIAVCNQCGDDLADTVHCRI
jgi:hypothetical protein